MLIYLKLGGSLITDKAAAQTPRMDTITRLANEIAQARREKPELQLVFGHGSGSFGHVPARKYGTRGGVKSPEQWRGFIEVWQQARELNQIMINALLEAGLPVIAFPPSSFILSRDGEIHSWNTEPINAALAAGLIPVVNGDVVLDTVRGGTIFSTEDVFSSLARVLTPEQILLCGLEEGIWADYPDRRKLLSSITVDQAEQFLPQLGGSAGIDVTGGMVEKVRLMIALIKLYPHLQCMIFSGQAQGNLYHALKGNPVGTIILK